MHTCSSASISIGGGGRWRRLADYAGIYRPVCASKNHRTGATSIPNFDNVRQLIVGTQRGDFTRELLVKHGFAKIELTSTIELSVQRLIGSRVDLVMASSTYYDQLKREGVSVEAVLQLEPLRYAIACNPSVPDNIVAAMRVESSKLIASGEQASIISQYRSDAEKTAAVGNDSITMK